MRSFKSYWLEITLTTLILIGLIFMSRAVAFGGKRPEATPSPTPIVSPTPSPSPSATPTGEDLVSYDPASGIEKSFAMAGIDLLNQAFKSGCIKKKFETWNFKSVKNIEMPLVQNKAEAYERFIAGRPYALNLRWYSTLKGVVGYTFNWLDGIDYQKCYNAAGGCKSETKIYSNSRIVKYYTPKDRAAHWAHELSHQARAGGFVHWTFHAGSFPYEIGDIVESCL